MAPFVDAAIAHAWKTKMWELLLLLFYIVIIIFISVIVITAVPFKLKAGAACQCWFSEGGGGGREGENEEGKGGTQMQVGSEKELNCHYEPTSNNWEHSILFYCEAHY